MDKSLLRSVISALGMSSAAMAAQAEVVPFVELQQKYTDNVYKQASDERHSWITTITPGVALQMQQGANDYELGANTEAGYYTVDSSNDYVDWTGYGKAGLEFNSRNRLDLRAAQSHLHDDAGEGRFEGTGLLNAIGEDDLDEFDQTDFDTKYTLGSKEAKGRMVLRHIYMDKDYNTNEGLVNGTDYLDRVDNEYRATAYWRAMPKTSLLFEVREKDIDYSRSHHTLADAGGTRMMDSDESRVYIGAEWEATAKTTGAVRVGHLEKDFREPVGISAPVDDYDLPSWEVSVTWEPRSYSAFTFDTSRGFTESSTTGTAIDRSEMMLSWDHSWSSLLSSRAFLRHYTDDYVSTLRDDDVNSIGGGMTYELTRWMAMRADYAYEDRNSTLNGNDYTGNLVVFGLDMKFD